MARPANDEADLTAWPEQPKEQFDVKKTVLVLGLATLSWVATYVGMLELIEANSGDLSILHRLVVGASVAMLMTMIVWLLDQLFRPVGAVTKIAYVAGYLFLTIISVGFGFGFYWKVLESKGEGTRVAEMAVNSVQAPLQMAATRLDSLSKTLDNLAQISAQKADQERTLGTSCPNSKPGDGPRRRLRDDDATRFAGARDFVKGRVDGVKAELSAIEGEFAKITKGDTAIVAKDGTRNDFMKSLNRRLDQTVTTFNAVKSDPQLRSIRSELNERAAKTQFMDTAGKPFTCPDAGLQSMIRAVVASIDALPTLEKPKIVTVEGSDATIEAFRRLTTTFFGALSFKLPPSAEELRELQKKAVGLAEATPERRAQLLAQAQAAAGAEAGLSKRDYIPLSVAIFVDLCLLLVAMGRTRDRLGNLVPKMQAAERGPVIQILSRFNEIHKDQQIRANFEIFRHVVFDMNGDYYVAVPLDAPPRTNPKDREELRLEAQLLANLFTSFEQEKIFSRVLMPYITTRQIQKKLWKQGSKFAHAETFRLYKFKSGAYSEIILGAIMGAAKRVDAQKRTRRLEEDLFTRHEPSFAGPVSHRAADLAGARAGREDESAALAGAPSRPVPPPPFVHRPTAASLAQSLAQAAGSMPGASEATARVTPLHPPQPSRAGAQAAGPVGMSSVTPGAFGPYAAAAAADLERSSDMTVPPRPTHEVLADLSAHRQRVEAEAEIAVRVANSNTAPVAAGGWSAPTHEPEAEAMITPAPVVRSSDVGAPAAAAAADSMIVEAVERRVTYHVPTRETSIPVSFQAMLAPTLTQSAERNAVGAPPVAFASTDQAAAEEPVALLPLADHGQPITAEEADGIEVYRPAPLPVVDEETTTIATRFAPASGLRSER